MNYFLAQIAVSLIKNGLTQLGHYLADQDDCPVDAANAMFAELDAFDVDAPDEGTAAARSFMPSFNFQWQHAEEFFKLAAELLRVGKLLFGR